MADFDKALPTLLQHEGGFVQDPDDPGGATNMGITVATLSAWRGRDVTPNDVRDLDREEAGAIYRERYWDAIRADEIENQDVAAAIFDYAVNAGASRAVVAAQHTVNWLYNHQALVQDGIIGPNTLRWVNSCTPRDFLTVYFRKRMTYYRTICRMRPTLRKFLYAWLVRSLHHSTVREEA